MKIVAIDFETANSSPLSACAIGISMYDNSYRFQDAYLICPPKNADTFLYYNVKVHGIRKEDVVNAPPFDWVYNQIKGYLKDSVVLAHNAQFDMSVLKALLKFYNLEPLDVYVIDTVKLARVLFPNLKSHGLSSVATHLNIPLKHHDAKSDADTCLRIYLFALAQFGSHQKVMKLSKMKKFSNF